MGTVTLKLTPLDVLFFRDARPFGAADYGESGLPAPPSFAGLLKTRAGTVADPGAPARRPAALQGLHDRNRPREQWHWLAQVRTRGPWLYVAEPQQLPRHLDQQ